MKHAIYLIFGIFLMTSPLNAKEMVPDPCKILSHAEVEEIMQISMKEGRFRDKRGTFIGFVCTYFSKNRFEKSGILEITIDTTEDMKANDHIFASTKEMYDRRLYAYREALKRQKKEDELHKIKGLGDDAYWNGRTIKILDKDTYIEVRADRNGGISAKDSETFNRLVEERSLNLTQKAAKKIVEKLKKKSK
jgi:hypothetical protein